jgi:hypothetical protein
MLDKFHIFKICIRIDESLKYIIINSQFLLCSEYAEKHWKESKVHNSYPDFYLNGNNVRPPIISFDISRIVHQWNLSQKNLLVYGTRA